MANWNLVDWRPDNINRMNSPDVWENIYKNGIIPEELKQQLLREMPEVQGKDVEFGIYFSPEGFATLSAYADGLAYSNGGVQWACVGGAEIDKRLHGSRTKLFPVETAFGAQNNSLDSKIQSASSRAGKVQPLDYDRELAERFSGSNLCDVATPQEAAELFGRPVRDGDRVYFPLEEQVARASSRTAESPAPAPGRAKDPDPER